MLPFSALCSWRENYRYHEAAASAARLVPCVHGVRTIDIMRQQPVLPV